MAMCLPVAAQKSAVWRDSFNAGVNYSLNVGEADIDYNGVAINAGYRKFLYGGSVRYAGGVALLAAIQI